MAIAKNNTSKRLLAVGDIHGCLGLLKRLLQKVAPQGDDQLVFLGDYIDRGPDSRGVLDTLLAFRAQWPQTIFLKGNHEAMLLDFLAGRERLRYLLNGGESTLSHYRRQGGLQFPPHHQQFLDSLRLYYETEHFIFAHAGLRPGTPPDEQQEQDLLWIRDEFLQSNYSWGKCIVFGHTPFRKPLLGDERIGLDTGAVYGRSLSCCDVIRRKIWTVQESDEI